MAVTGVLRPGHIVLRVLDLDEAIRHYTHVIGLFETGRDEQGRVFFKAWDENDHHSVVLREADSAGMDYFGWKVDSEKTLDELAAKLEASPLARDTLWLAPGEHLATGRRFQFTIPTGHRFELYATKEALGCMTGYENPDPWPDGLRGMAPSRFDHALLHGRDIDSTLELFRDILGFDLTERVVGPDGEFLIAVFLTCSNKAHDVAFIRSEEDNRFHHASFILGGWNEVLHAADIISKRSVSLDIGPTRHGITRGETIYFFDPSGNRNEVFAGGYIWYPDRPVITWHDHEIGRAIFYHDRKLNEAFLNVTT